MNDSKRRSADQRYSADSIESGVCMSHSDTVREFVSLLKPHNEARLTVLLGARASFSSRGLLADESVSRHDSSGHPQRRNVSRLGAKGGMMVLPVPLLPLDLPAEASRHKTSRIGHFGTISPLH